MEYNELLSEIKKLFIKKLEKIVSDEAYIANPQLSRNSYLETLYSDIMALGYNFKDIKKSTDDVYQIHAQLNGESKELYKHIQMSIAETERLYPGLIEIFSDFHTKTQAEEDFKKVLSYIKGALEKQ